MGAPADRATTILGWIVAVATCVVAAFLLTSITHGYVLAIHHQLRPNNDEFAARRSGWVGPLLLVTKKEPPK
jgi:hypothetical protein